MPIDTSNLTEWLTNHPRLTSALFVTLVLLTKAGAVAANSGSVTNGP